MIDKRLIFPALEADSKEDVIRALSCQMLAVGKVRETYQQAVLDREQTYPTGLALDGVCIAIPHTFAQHVVEPAIAVAKLAKPVTFLHMGTTDTTLDVTLVLMMAITDPQQQLGMLKKILQLFSDEKRLAQVVQGNTVEALYSALRYIDQ